MLAYLKSIYLLTKAQITIFKLAANPIKFSKRLLRWDLKIVFIFLIMPWKTNSDSVNNIKIASYMSYSRSICTCTSHTQANSLGPLSEKLYKAWMQRWGSQQHSPTSGSIRFMGALVSRTHWWHWGWKGSWQQKTHSFLLPQSGTWEPGLVVHVERQSSGPRKGCEVSEKRLDSRVRMRPAWTVHGASSSKQKRKNKDLQSLSDTLTVTANWQQG